MELSFLLIVSILGAATQASDLSGSLFLFPSESDYVTLEPKLTTPLNSFTICLRAFTELTCHHGLLSVNSSTQGTIIQLSVNHGDAPYSVSVGDHELHFKALGHAPVRKHICATWDSDTGVTQVFLNADKLARKVMSHGYTIEGPLQITLGQKKDHLTNLFNVRQSFIGEIGDVHIWDSVLSPAGIYQAHMSNPYMTGNVVNWRHLHYETTGRVLVLPVQ